ncbi:mycothiol system anti-sigma-R factor [Streptosporangium nondiastaticum]|uniref:Mycothiol system anti-sigma-R factor n=2 Tax=Actinomycetes TaxID=1760 RepID=A0A9X7JI00_9ACTN|nr:mycothiol system anti-sigma-R factor [Streptomyces sp. VNUA116]PSJ24020.1 mycothiol system anti-sigma-R factor [Streptosporangium nondiastaticum]WKU46934.1 mycothiol system anti-sigma-R factor [Streptomyces sp. VNUA116]
MSCGDPHETDCSEVLDHLYEFLDHEMPDGDCAKFEVHIDECSPCLEKYGLEQAVKKLVKRCCGHDDVPADLRSKVMGRIELIRAGQSVPEQDVVAEARAAEAAARTAKGAESAPGAKSTRSASGGPARPGPLGATTQE